ncbi:MAG: VWA domain-containing protein [Phycisphaerae bacterium]|nr:VWA domain-containing protein [Phycisphaerae bacterium]
MTALFRCPECNRPLHNRHGDDPTKGCVLRCRECGGRLVVPAALAPAPHPQIDTPIPATADDGPQIPAARPVVLPAMARSMPWLMSMCFHVALAMIFMFIAMIAIPKPPDIRDHRAEVSYIRDARPVSDSSPFVMKHRQRPRQRRPRGQDGADREVSTRKLENLPAEDTIGVAALTGIETNEDPRKRIGPPGDKTIFSPPTPFPPPPNGRLPDVVYLIDRSGSMVDTFETVRHELLMSIGRMTPDRRFHVVLFSDGRPIEKSPRAMTPATEKAKTSLVEFLKPVCASGKTDPIPAINRAFDVLKRKRGSAGDVAVIYLLTDGVFPENDSVLETIRRRNAGRRIRINTILYGNRPPIAEEVMTRIASDSGGVYRFISRDE